MNSSLPPQLFAFLLILRWTIAIIFFANGMPKLSDPAFGAHADSFFHSLRDDIIFTPYIKVFDVLILPNAFLFAAFVKYAEVFLAFSFFIGFPLSISTFVALLLHANYLCIASLPTFVFLNIIMIAAEFTCLAATKK
jgi:uncharacterized membrane protein YphA (DoxX/SURF4 family)